MALPTHTQYRTRGSYVNVYHFHKAGDTLPIHNHGVDHDAILVHGKIKAITPHQGEAELPIGHLMTMHSPHPHGFQALEDDTVLLNTFKDPEAK
jgi:hypothetical protein